MTLAEPPEPGQQPAAGEPRRHAERQRRRAARRPPLPVDRGEAVIDPGQAVTDRGGQGLPVGRERQRARQALEQRPPERVLEPPDPLAHGPLRHAQFGAARVKLRWRAAASKACRSASGGRQLFNGTARHPVSIVIGSGSGAGRWQGQAGSRPSSARTGVVIPRAQDCQCRPRSAFLTSGDLQRYVSPRQSIGMNAYFAAPGGAA